MEKQIKPLITVIIPVYNSEKYIGDCIESVINQTYRNLQLILVEDGACDKSPEICDYYAEQDDRIEVIHKKNEGVSAAKNTGLAYVRGEYIKLLDHDDYLHPQALDICMKLAVQTGADIVQHGWTYMQTDTQKPDIKPIDKYRHWQLDIGEAILQIEPATCQRELGEASTLATVVLWSKLFKRHIFEGIQFDPSVRIHEDQRVVHRLLAKAENGVIYTDTILYFFRETPGSLSRRQRGWERLEIVDCYFDRLQCVRELPENVREAHNLLYHTYRRYLIGVIKNYRSIAKNMKKEPEYSRYKKELLEKYRKTREICKMKETWKDFMLFQLFEWYPRLFEF